jgi:hypothetical protein
LRDCAQPHDADCLAAEFDALLGAPPASTDGAILIGNTARDIEHEGERVLGHSAIAAAYDIGDGNAALGSFRDINVFDSGTGDADHAQLWAGVDDCSGKFRKGWPKGKNDASV